MILSSVPQFSSNLLVHVLEPAARSLALGCMVGLAFAVSRARSVALRLNVWKAVLCVALAMPVLGAMLPAVSLNVPSAAIRRGEQLFSLSRLASAVPNASSELATQKLPETVLASRNSRSRFQSSRGSAAHTNDKNSTSENLPPAITPTQTPAVTKWNFGTIPWTFIAAAIYVSVALIFLASVMVGLFFGRRLDRTSWPVHDPRAVALLSSRAREAGVQNLPRLAESELLSIPVTFGVLRPSVLLPAGWREWDAAELDAVISHEISHVARRDALTERLSLLHRALFWFSPLSWWLHRHLAELAEEASDEAALAAGAERTRYAETLLGFFADIEAAPGRAWWQGVAMATAGQAEKRLDRILGWKGSVTVQLKKSVVAAVVLSAVPVVCLTAALRPRIENINSIPSQSAQDQAPPAPTPASPAPTPAPLPAAAPGAIAPAPPVVKVSTVTHVAPVVSVAPAVSVAPVVSVSTVARVASVPPVGGVIAPPALGQSQSAGTSRSNTHMSWSGNGQEFVIVSGNSYISISHDNESYGSGDAPEFVEYLQEKNPGDFIWFHRDGKSYIIRDQATIARAKQLFAPAMALGEKQEALGKLQEALGEKQEALGKQQEEVHVQIPDMTAELRKLEAELKALGTIGTQEDLGRVQEEIGDLQSKLGELQSKAGEEQGKLGEQQGKLGEEQGKLGEQQGKLGEEQERASKEAARQMKSIIDDAVAKGLAKPE